MSSRMTRPTASSPRCSPTKAWARSSSTTSTRSPRRSSRVASLKDIMSRLWDKGTPLDARVLAFTAGEDHALDERLVRYDVLASIAHARMLVARGLLSQADFTAIEQGLQEIGAAHAKGKWKIELADEDGQTALEKHLTAKIGAAGGRVHLGRSRNDQVLTALRLYLKDAAEELAKGVEGVVAALDQVVDKQGGIALPGYTHM